MNSIHNITNKRYGTRIMTVLAVSVTIIVAGTALAQDYALKSVQSCVTIQGLTSNGSGFFFKAKNGKIYIATNKHVVENEIAIEIRDIDDDVFKPVKIWVDSNRDLAFIEFDGGEKKPRHILSADLNVSEMSFGREIVAYGDSDGEGTIVALDGKLLGIGPSSIETDAYLIHGNSGGPIVDQRTGAVLGISTRVEQLSEVNQELVKGSRFEGKIRRFGTRIDNLKIEKLKEADYIKYDFYDYGGLAEYATQLLKSRENDKKITEQVSGILWHVFKNNDIEAMGKVASKLLEVEQGEYNDVLDLAVDAILSASENDSVTALTWKGIFTGMGIGSIAKDSKKAFDYFLKAAENGDNTASYCLYRAYLTGTGVPKNNDKAMEWLKKSADNGLPDAMGDYGWMLLNDGNLESVKYIDAAIASEYYAAFSAKGVLALNEEKKEEAAYWFRRGAEAYDPVAMCYLGDCCRDGIGLDRNINDAIYWYTNSAALGNLDAIRNLGYLYLDGDSKYGTRDYKESLKWFMQGADIYDGVSLCRIGLAYLEGLGVEKNAGEGLFYMEKSAACGYPDAISNVAYLYANGIGTETNILLALEWYERGYYQTEDGMFAWDYCETLWRTLSHMIAKGEDCSEYIDDWLIWFVRGYNSDGAREWLKFVQEDNKRLQWLMLLADGKIEMPDDLTIDIAEMFTCEVERIRNPEAAFLWYSRAVKVHPNYFISNAAFAACYETGFGIPKNSEQAERILNELKKDKDSSYFYFEQFASLAEKGDAMSEYFLALFYKYGIGVPIDLEEAKGWMEKSKQDGCPFLSQNQ